MWNCRLLNYFVFWMKFILLSQAQEFRTRSKPITLMGPREVKAYDSKSLFCPKLDYKPAGKTILTAKTGYSNHVQSKVTGGGLAGQSVFPWFAFLSVDDSWLCAGSLIKEDWVLTSANCVFGATGVVVNLGGVDRNVEDETGEVSYESKQIVIHSAYSDGSLSSDIALIQLMESATLGLTVNLARLPPLNYAVKVFHDRVATVTGYGIDSETNGVVHFADLNLIKNSQCASYFGAGGVPASVMCALPFVQKYFCAADSGSPLVIQEADGLFAQIGVASFGVESACSRFPIAFTRVTSFLGWISMNTDIKIRP